MPELTHTLQSMGLKKDVSVRTWLRADDLTSYITGENLTVDGGTNAYLQVQSTMKRERLHIKWRKVSNG